MRFFDIFVIHFALLNVCLCNEDCYLPIDVMFLQDTTGSFVKDLPIVVNQIPDMVASILRQNPESWFGVAEFKDKPYYPLGQQGSDFCYKLNGALTPEVAVFESDYKKLYASGGGDIPEAQYQALIDIAQDPSVGWRTLVSDARTETAAGARVVVLSTDAPPHLPGDMAKWNTYHTVPQGLPSNPGSITLPDMDDACLFYDYPSPQQMAAAIKNQNIYVALLTPNYSNMTAAWHWFNEDLLGQPADFYQFIAEDSSDLMDGVLRVLKSVTETACATTSTTTEKGLPPTTEALPTTTEVLPTTTTLRSTGSTLVGPSSQSSAAEGGCPECATDCQTAAVVIKIADRPQKLHVDYSA